MIELSYYFAFIFVFVACVRILHMNSRAEWPELFANGTTLNFGYGWKFSSRAQNADGQRTKEDSFVTQILKHAPIFSRPYIPPLIWGRSGHLQTIIHSTLSRHKTPREKGDSRHSILLSDGSTVTFDLFLPPTERLESSSGLSGLRRDVTLVVCPGIGNSSESLGIRTFCDLANQHGYRLAVLNHLGVIPNIPLTSPRIFSYGSTEEYGAMVDEVRCMYPKTCLVAVGFSMGGNLVCKYVGESAEQRAKVTAVVSCCQGYDIFRSLEFLKTWDRLGAAYLRAVNICVQKILRNFQDVLLTDSMLQRYQIGSKYDVLYSGDLVKVDSLLLSKMAGYNSCEEYYRSSSSAMYIPQIDIPVLFINAKDDPLIFPELFDVPEQHTAVNDKALFIVTKHGGHLGFYACEEGTSLFSFDTYSWLDKAIIEYVRAALLITGAAGCRKSEKSDDEGDNSEEKE